MESNNIQVCLLTPPSVSEATKQTTTKKLFFELSDVNKKCGSSRKDDD